MSTPAAFATSSSALPDQRAYELVSAPGSGEPYLPPTPIEIGAAATGFRARLPFRAAGNGEAVAYVGEPSATKGTGETGPGEGNQWLATRSAGGWTTEDITPNENRTAMYESFSSDLASASYEGDTTPLTAEVEPGCAALYSRATATKAFQALFTAGQTPRNCGHPLYAGASETESQIIFESEAALTPDSEEATESDIPPGHGGEHRGGALAGEGCMFGCNLYDWVDGGLRLVNVIEGVTVPNATFGGYAGEHELTNFSNAISQDGSRIFWTDTQEGSNMEHVYVLEDGTSTVAVSGSEPAEYWTATPDGRYAFYTEAGELWRFDTSDNTREKITAEGAKVQGVIGTNTIGEDGSYLYFVADGVLTGEEENEAGEEASEGEPNLYLLHGGAPTFIATLSAIDNELQSASEGNHETSSDWRANMGERLSQVAPDGQHLVFQSVNELTGYEASLGTEHQPEVFVYSAGDGHLACASCDPAGDPPAVTEGSLPKTRLPVSAEAETYMRRWISASGSRVFFDSAEPLVTQDTNEVQDVYEWERPATPSEPNNTCTAAAASAVTGGCTFLLSGGISKHDSFLVDDDATGENVFFEHVGPLGQVQAPVDHNELYDTRINGGFPQVSSGCTGSTCQPSVSAPPEFGSPSSATFSGIGNFPPAPVPHVAKPKTRQQKLAAALKSCKKDKSRSKRRSCERQARRRYGAKKAKRSATGSAKRASYDRRAHS